MASIFALTQKMTESSCGPHFTVKIHTQSLSGNRFHDSGNSKFFCRSSLLLWNVMETANFRLLIYSCTWIELHWILSTFLWLPSRLAISVSFQTAHAANKCDRLHLTYCFVLILFCWPSCHESTCSLCSFLGILLMRQAPEFVSCITIFSFSGIFVMAWQRYCWNDEEISVYHLIFLQSISN